MNQLTTSQINDLQDHYQLIKNQRKETLKQHKRNSRKKKLANFLSNVEIKSRHALGKYSKFVCIDVENYEHRQDWIMEIGMSIFTRDTKPQTRHFIIAQHKKRFNKKYVEDNKYNFDYGSSEIVTLPHAANVIRKEIHEGSIVVGHSLSGVDSKALHAMDVRMKATMDTQKLHSLLVGKKLTIGLSNLLKHYDIEPKHMHNGGNDAHFTAIACKLLLNDLKL